MHYVLVEERFTRRQVPGQQLANLSKNPWTILPRQGFVQQSKSILEKNRDAIHIFLSFWGDKRLFRVLLRALWQRQNVAVIFEAYSTAPYGYWKDEGRLRSHLKVLGRRVAYRMLWPLLRLVSRGKLPSVLAVSPMAEEQLRRVGFREEVIYPFGYFTEKKEIASTPKETDQPLRIVFSGSLIMRKGLDIAIAAMQQVNSASANVILDIYGPGEIKRFLMREIPGIHYKGMYPQQDAQKIISGYDLLVVPSRHEGWGLVVNEALMQGVPVVVSDRVGAKCMVEHSGAGLVFRNEDTGQLADLLLSLALDRSKLDGITNACASMNGLITPSVGADYLMKVIAYHFHNRGSRPQPGWLKHSI